MSLVFSSSCPFPVLRGRTDSFDLFLPACTLFASFSAVRNRAKE
ncbi:hypothetical protein HMPREF1326_01692 [Akkermansia sp. KLE1605]|nr:hypothetical protein HMPREF1326_01692 [Akkermansia sp. KLE1605]